jgi:hypothetical protein
MTRRDIKSSLKCLYRAADGLRRNMQRRLHEQIAGRRKGQKERFEAYQSRFKPMYEDLKRHSVEKFMTPAWKRFICRMEKKLVPLPFDFLHPDKSVLGCMWPGPSANISPCIEFLSKRLPPGSAEEILMEDSVGRPPLMPDYLSSTSIVYKAADLVSFFSITGGSFSDMRAVVEWGGGYGCLAKIAKRMSPNPLTYIIIDLPLISSIQWLYLSTIFGESAVRLFRDGSESIQEGKFNLIPVCFAEKYSLKADLFISTFALNESSPYAHDFVDRRDFFGAEHILLAYLNPGNSTCREGRPIIESMALKRGLKIREHHKASVSLCSLYAYR